MRFLIALLVLATFTAAVLAWSKEDHELFRVRDELNTLEGADTSFYAFLGVPPSASLAEVNKQNKKRSRQLHPDKAIPAMLAQRSAPGPRDPKDKSKKPGVTVTRGPTQKDREAVSKEANMRYQLFSVVVGILRSPQRERYDHFLKNGFPVWRGTGYYFKRYRPGLATVLAGLMIVFGGAGHYGAMLVGYQRQRRFVAKYVDRARSAAWGNVGGVPNLPGMPAGAGADTPPPIPDDDEGANEIGQMPMNRRQKRWQEKEDRKKKDSRNDSPAPRPARAVRDRTISRPVEGQTTSGPSGMKKRVQAENGKTLIVDSVGHVYLEEMSEEGEVREFLLDPDEIPYPSIMQTALCRLPIFLYKQSIGRAVDRFRGISESEDELILDEEGAELTMAAVSMDEKRSLGSASAMNANGDGRNRRARVNGIKADQ